MKRFFLVLGIFIFLSAGSCFAQDSIADCTGFLTGTFRYEEEPYTAVVIQRTETKQIESVPATGSKSIFKIVWKNDCEYDLIFVRSNRPANINKGDVINVKIIEINEGSYVYEAYFRGTTTSYTIRKVSE